MSQDAKTLDTNRHSDDLLHSLKVWGLHIIAILLHPACCTFFILFCLWWHKAANQGEPNVQSHLGYMHKTGLEVSGAELLGGHGQVEQGHHSGQHWQYKLSCLYKAGQAPPGLQIAHVPLFFCWCSHQTYKNHLMKKLSPGTPRLTWADHFRVFSWCAFSSFSSN